MIEKQMTDNGVKAYQRTDSENRAKPYFDFHRKLDRSLTAQDIDNIEYKITYAEGRATIAPVAVIELTRYDSNDYFKAPTVGYLSAILQRFQRDAQGEVICSLAKMLGVDAYIILFKTDCTCFWVYNLSRGGVWTVQNAMEHELFLKKLRS